MNKEALLSLISLLICGAPWLPAHSEEPARGNAPSALPESHMTFLDNAEVRDGMALAMGGAVAFISSQDHPELKTRMNDPIKRQQ